MSEPESPPLNQATDVATPLSTEKQESSSPTETTHSEKLSDGSKTEIPAGKKHRLSAPTVYHIIRNEGIEELSRPVSSLWWSGVAAGLIIFTSIISKSLLHHYLPETPYRPLIENLGYSVGFIAVIMGRMQLFTENTITTVLPILSGYSIYLLWRTIRIWCIVFTANMVGTFSVAAFVLAAAMQPPEHLQAYLEISRHFAEKGFMECLFQGIPAGFLISALVWILPSAKASQFWVILMLTYLIGLGDYTHVVAGSSEIFLLVLNGELGFINGVVYHILPTLIGNVFGGTFLFTLMAYAQVREEL